MVTKLKLGLKVFLTAVLVVVVLTSAVPTVVVPISAAPSAAAPTSPAPSVAVSTSAAFEGALANAPLSPEFDLSRIYLKNPLSRKVALEIGTGEDSLRFEGTLSKQVKLSGEEIQVIAMSVLSDMGITFLEFREMQAEIRKSLAEPKAMTPEEREQFISDLLAVMKLPGATDDILGLFNKIAAGKSEEEILKETLIEKALDEADPLGALGVLDALEAIDRSWQAYNKKWQNFEYLNKSKIIVDEFYTALQREIDKYKAEKGYKGVLIFKAEAIRSGFHFLNSYSSFSPPNTQVWELELVLEQKTITGEDTLEGATSGELGSLAGHYEGRYKLHVKSQLKEFSKEFLNNYKLIGTQTCENLENIALSVAQGVYCDECQYGSPSGLLQGWGNNLNARAVVDWEIQGACEADMFENGSMAFGVDPNRIESIRNNFSELTNNIYLVVERRINDGYFYYSYVILPIAIKAIPNQKKVYLEYSDGPYEGKATEGQWYDCPAECGPRALTALKNRLNTGGWYEEEYAWDYRIHSPWEDEDGTVAPLLLSLVE